MSESENLSLELETEIQRELGNLFLLQGKTLPEKMEAAWIEEIRKSRIPKKAILLGIQSLKAEDVSKLTYGTILSASRRFVEPDQAQETGCPHCSSGFVCMKDPEGRWYSLACTCPAGDGKKLVRWNGETTQHSMGRILRLPFAETERELVPF